MALRLQTLYRSLSRKAKTAKKKTTLFFKNVVKSAKKKSASLKSSIKKMKRLTRKK